MLGAGKIKINHKTTITIAALSVILFIFFSLFIFQIKFGSINIPRIIYATIVVNTSENKYYIIKDDNSHKNTSESNSKKNFFASPKKVIIATPNSNYNFSDYVKSIGYNIVEDKQYGGKIVIEKDGNQEEVFISSNQYYSLWQWY